MTASIDPATVIATPKADAPMPKPSAGRLLREARLKVGTHLAVLSVNLKVPIRELEALESDAWDVAKGPVFYRGLAASVCRHLRTDPAEILALLPPASGQLPPVGDALGLGIAPREFSRNSRPFSKSAQHKVIWTAALLLALTASFLWMPGPNQWVWLVNIQASLASDDRSESADTSSSIDSAGKPTRDALDNGMTTTEVAIPLGSFPAAVNSAGAVLPPVLTTTAVAAPRPERPVESSNQGSLSSGPEWVFSASDDSWLEVRDAQQETVWSGILKSGEVARIQSPLPVRVVVGRAQSVAVSFRGQPFDLKPHTKVAVARFEVKE